MEVIRTSALKLVCPRDGSTCPLKISKRTTIEYRERERLRVSARARLRFSTGTCSVPTRHHSSTIRSSRPLFYFFRYLRPYNPLVHGPLVSVSVAEEIHRFAKFDFRRSQLTRIMRLPTECELRSRARRSDGEKRRKAKERSGRFREKLRCFSFGTRVGVASA